MKVLIQLPVTGGSATIRSYSRSRSAFIIPQRFIHTTPPKPATVIGNLTATGPPPTAPLPSAEYVDSRVARRRKQAELLKRGQDLRAVAGRTGGGTAKLKRFWKDVIVKRTDGETIPRQPTASLSFISTSRTLCSQFLLLQKVSRSISTNAPSAVQRRKSLQYHTISLI